MVLIFPNLQYLMNTNISQGNHYIMHLMLLIDNVKSVTSHFGSVIDLLLIKSFRFKFPKFMLIVSLIFALSVGLNALTMQQSKFSPQKGQS